MSRYVLGLFPCSIVKESFDASQLDRARTTHDRSLQQVLTALEDEQVSVLIPDLLDERAIEDKELVITVGGDGTALSVHHLLDDVPLLAVNSDPERSVGHYTRCTGDTFPQLFQQWQQDQHCLQELARLQLLVNDNKHSILNDCLICNSNPSSMSRYLLKTPGGTRTPSQLRHLGEYRLGKHWRDPQCQALEPVNSHEPALLYIIREPFQGRQKLQFLKDVQSPPDFIEVVAGLNGLAAYVDGDHACYQLQPGDALRIEANPKALKLVAPMPTA